MTGFPSSHEDLCPSRRDLLRGLAALGIGTIAGGVLAACGSDIGQEAPSSEPSHARGNSTGPGSEAAEPSSSDPSAPTVVAAVSQVPVGQARVVEVGGQRLVVAQPTAGSFVAFSTTCTHQGTPVNVLQGLELACPNHGSRFSAADGSVSRGPATAPLATVDVRLVGDRVVLG